MNKINVGDIWINEPVDNKYYNMTLYVDKYGRSLFYCLNEPQTSNLTEPFNYGDDWPVLYKNKSKLLKAMYEK